jgi:hypothetical protein
MQSLSRRDLGRAAAVALTGSFVARKLSLDQVLGRVIRQARGGLSVAAVASAARIEPAELLAIEGGQDVGCIKCNRIALALGTTVEQLVDAARGYSP